MNEPQTPFQKIIDELLDEKREISRRSLQEFSDISPSALEALLKAWPNVQPERKRQLLDGLQSLSDTDTLVSFDDLARALLGDGDAQIRMRAIRLLAECDDVKLVPAYLQILEKDEEALARAEAANALGRYVWLGEVEEIPHQIHHQVEDSLLSKVGSDDKPNVRRQALEALGYSSRPEVVTLIETASQREDPDWQASALLAMGRSSDDRWEEQVLLKIEHDDPHVQLAAVEAAGELSLGSARRILLKLLDEEIDDEVASAAIWSLSQIGGEDARIYIENLLDQAEDEELVEFLEDALDNLAFTEDSNRFDLMSLDTDEDE